jgi:hypothetical protein
LCISVLSSGDVEPIDPEAPHLVFCGSVYCPWSLNGTAGGNGPDESQVNLLFSIYLGCAIGAAIVVAVLVDPLTRYLIYFLTYSV